MKMMNKQYSIDAINNMMSLRLPQYKSLEILDNIMGNMDFQKENAELEHVIHEKYPIFKEFQRAFPSLTFALATGVGKTMLMGAFITYLYTNYGIKNFFIVAPNLTIYNKLIDDFGRPESRKYVFKGIDIFMQNPPNVITGETYHQFVAGQKSLWESITINIFNIGKINAEVRGNKVPLVKRLSEYIGESYFDYLAGLSDLVVLMDESHHYRADRGMTVINELNPLLGLELTATPQVETSHGTEKFRNVVYEYSLARAIIDGYVKEPAAATRKDFDTRNYNPYEIDHIKLNDGIRIHRNTKAELHTYAENECVKTIKPFVLVVCKDTAHAAEVKEYITSEEFYGGYYADKVIEVHSNQRGEEKEENIQKLLSLEKEDNDVEIVIHVNMLKEGWDVTNLYTIIPLRTAASLTLREQTIGRGLRMPYGKRTGNPSVDRLTIVAHDKFEEIINAANEETSIIKQENIIVIEDDEDLGREKEVVQSKTILDDYIEQKKKNLRYARSEEKKQALTEDIETSQAIGRAIEEILTKPVNITVPFSKNSEDNAPERIHTIKRLVTVQDLKKPEVVTLIKEKAKQNLEDEGQLFIDTESIDKKINFAIAPLIEQTVKSTIEIPEIIIVQKGEQVKIYNDFDLSTRFWPTFNVPSDDIIIESLKDNEVTMLINEDRVVLSDTPQDIIFGEMLSISTGAYYEEYIDLFYKQIDVALDYISKGKKEQDIAKIIIHDKKEIAALIWEQLEIHSSLSNPEYDVKLIRTSMPILQQNFTKFKEDEIVKYTQSIPAYEIKKKVVGHFSKACHSFYKFDSVPEHIFSIILERSERVQKWMRPAAGQFKIHTSGAHLYEPDFVVETDDIIYIVEIKAHSHISDDDVQLKSKAARAYCSNVNKLFKGTGKKEWKYMLLIDGDIARNVDFAYLERETEFYSLG